MEDLAVDTKVETEETCPIMSSQGFSPVRCRKDCAWFSNVCLIAGIEKTRIEECVIKTISRAICDIPTWRQESERIRIN